MPKSGKKPLTGDYEVGHGRPPKHCQWKPGQSGNPRGPAPLECLSFLEALNRAWKRRISLPLNGKKVRMSVLEAAAHKLMNDAAMGVPSARRELLRLLPFAEALRESSEDVVWDVKLVFDEEEDRYLETARENEQLKQEVTRLQELLQQSQRHRPS